jgi:TRAP-type uncharacterized transport system fused permease subunit
MKTGFTSVKLALAGFIVPYMFMFNNELLLLNTTLPVAIRVAATSVIGVAMLGITIEGYLRKEVPVLLRIAAFAGALLLITADVTQDIIGFVILAVILAQQLKGAKAPPLL